MCWPYSPMQQAINKNVQKIPTYRKVLTDHHSMNSEPQSHLLATAYMSQVESLRLHQKDSPRLRKACVSLWSFGSFEVRNHLPENCVNICSVRDMASWHAGAWPTGWPLLRTIPPTWLNHWLMSHSIALHWNAAHRRICAPLLWVTSPRIRRLEKIVCGP
jgi:hypothetical protein